MPTAKEMTDPHNLIGFDVPSRDGLPPFTVLGFSTVFQEYFGTTTGEDGFPTERRMKPFQVLARYDLRKKTLSETVEG